MLPNRSTSSSAFLVNSATFLLWGLALGVFVIVFAAVASGANITKANNTTNLNLTGSWLGAAVPGASDIAIWNSTVTAANTVLLGANQSWEGLTILNPVGNVTISAGNTLTLGSSGLNMSAATENLILNNAVVLNGPQTWNVNTETATVTGVVSGNATSNLLKSGTGTLSFSGANTYTGNTTVSGGTLLLNLTTNPTGILSSSSKLTLGGGNLTVEGKSSGTSSQTLASLTLSPNTTSALMVNSNGGSSTTLTLGNASTFWNRSDGSTVNIDLSTSKSFLASNTTLTNGIIGYATVTDSAGATGFATISGGNIVLYTGGTSGGTPTSTTNYILSGTNTSNANYSVNSLFLDTTTVSGSVDMGSPLNVVTLTSGALMMNGTNNFALGDGQVGASNQELIVHQMGPGTLTLNGTVSGGTGSLTKDGPGQLTLTGNNVFTGATVVSGGTLLAAGTGSNQALGKTGAVIINSGGTLMLGASNQINASAAVTLNGGTFNTGGFSQGSSTASGLGTMTLSASSTIDLGAGSSIISFANSTGNAWTSGAMLSILDWSGNTSGDGTDRIYFGVTGLPTLGLTSGQISQIQFVNPAGLAPGTYDATLLGTDELVPFRPVPETSTTFAGGALVLLTACFEYRRRRQSRDSNKNLLAPPSPILVALGLAR
jgi:autotransporter-associated beta strand protein